MKSSSTAYRTIVLLSLGVLTGCVEIPLLQSTPDPEVDRYEFHAAEGKSRAFFIHGPVRTCGASGCSDQKLSFPFAVYIDGIKIDTMTSRSEYLRAEIPAGKHLMQWKDLADAPDRLQGDTEVTMEKGQSYFLRVNKGSGAAAGTRGATGRLEDIGKEGRVEVSERTLVIADPEVTRRVPQPVAAEATPASAPKAKPSETTVKDKLAELKAMYDAGLITKEEYDGKRKQFLEKWN